MESALFFVLGVLAVLTGFFLAYWGSQRIIHTLLKQFNDLLDMTKMLEVKSQFENMKRHNIIVTDDSIIQGYTYKEVLEYFSKKEDAKDITKS